jgi:hypothetical protein
MNSIKRQNNKGNPFESYEHENSTTYDWSSEYPETEKVGGYSNWNTLVGNCNDLSISGGHYSGHNCNGKSNLSRRLI